MNTLNAATLVNWLGFLVGVALFALLGAMVLRHRGGPGSRESRLLLVTTAVLGLIWNLSELVVFVLRDFGFSSELPLLTAASYAALGFLPSVVVHSAQYEESGSGRWIAFAAYSLSTIAAILHFYAAVSGANVPSATALMIFTIGAPIFALALVIVYLRETLAKKAVWASALLIFAVASLHFVSEREETSWIIELVAHQSSLPLVLVILYQNYRFAFADLFLKRAISILLLSFVAFGLYAGIAAPLLRFHETHDRNDVQAVSLILVLWIATALAYPALHRIAEWLVDTVILHRADYAKLRSELVAEIGQLDTTEAVLDKVCSRVSAALTANESEWTPDHNPDASEVPAVDFTPDRARILIPTAEMPRYRVDLGSFQGGRRLLSDETAMLTAVSLLTARRIDALRVDHERCEQEFREQEFSKLAAEAQLTALRAQINPHFLFNALTTIGYLIKRSPERAFQTLLQLTKLLRGVLSKTAEFCSLDDEIKLIESYLEIERARFEERLIVEVNVPTELRNVMVPTLILQPLVENAIKHGIAECKSGGKLTIDAINAVTEAGDQLIITVTDTGSGKPLPAADGGGGIGLRNVADRLSSHYGRHAFFKLATLSDGRTEARVQFPLESAVRPEINTSEVTGA